MIESLSLVELQLKAFDELLPAHARSSSGFSVGDHSLHSLLMVSCLIEGCCVWRKDIVVVLWWYYDSAAEPVLIVVGQFNVCEVSWWRGLCFVVWMTKGRKMIWMMVVMMFLLQFINLHGLNVCRESQRQHQVLWELVTQTISFLSCNQTLYKYEFLLFMDMKTYTYTPNGRWVKKYLIYGIKGWKCKLFTSYFFFF